VPKKIQTTIIILLAISFFSFSARPKKKKTTVFEEGSWAEVTKLSKEKELPVFVFISAPYCNYSRRMERTFRKKALNDFLKANFVCKQLDVSNVFQNIRASNWGISAVPTYLILDMDGNIVYKASGSKEAEQLITEAGDALAGMGIEKKEITEEEELSAEKEK
jgi:thioredoxin-related protein